MRLRFRFRTIPFLAMLVLVAIGVLLGNWQTRRAAEKTALQARLAQRAAAPPLVLGQAVQDPAAIEFRRVIVTGRFVPTWPVFLDNRPLEGRSGFILLMPFTIAGSHKHVLVARGWLPRDPASSTRLPKFDTPAGSVTIEGIAVRRPARLMQLGTPPGLQPGAVVQNLEVDAFARASGLDMQPFLLEQTGPGAPAQLPAEALVRKWPAPGVDVDRHKGYAFQWYALAVMAFLFFVITGWRSGIKHGS
jgi:cytochrome oxidase assembly protein ShyY1